VGTGGSVYVVGDTHSTEFDKQTNLGGSDAFVTKFDASGARLTVFLGGAGNDSAYAVTTAADGSVYVAGGTTGSFDGQTNLGGSDAFLTKFNEAGVQQWTRFAGGAGSDTARSVALGTDGSVYVAGVTTGSFDGQTHQGNDDAFVTKFSASGVRQWTRLLGGTGYDEAYSVAVSADDSVYVAGRSDGSFGGQTNRGGSDAFLAKFDATGSWRGTQFFGGTGDDWAFSAAVAPAGVVYMAGAAGGSIDGQNHQGGYWDSFLTQYSPPILSEITFAAGSATATLTLKTRADNLTEGDEAVTVAVVAGNGYTVGTASSATGTIENVDTTAPTATLTTGVSANTANATVQSSELGTAYLVKTGGAGAVTVSNLASITNAGDAKFNSVAIIAASTGTPLSLAGLEDGTYSLFTVDAAGNLSAAASNTFTVDSTAPTLGTSPPSAAVTTLAGTAGNSVGEAITLTLTFDGNVSGLSSGTNNTIFKLGPSAVDASWSGSGSFDCRHHRCGGQCFCLQRQYPQHRCRHTCTNH
jgi:hypothetical protein